MSNSTPGSIVIAKVKRTRKRLFVSWNNGSEDRSVNSTENALPDFQTSLDALAPLVCEICAWPAEYAQDLRVMGVVMGEQGEADTVSIIAQKSLVDAGKALNISTPPRLLAHPTEPGSYTPPLMDAQAELVWALIEAAKDYAKGNRAQGELPGIGGIEEEDDLGGGEQPDENSDPLPFEAEEAAPKKRGRKKKNEAATVDV